MRECGDCTLCCTLLELHEVASKIDETCRHCNNGCEIHDSKPDECKTYQCMWSQMETVGDELRPDKCGIIFDRASNDVITARLEKGKLMNPFVSGQVNAFINEGFSVNIFRGKEMKTFLNDNHTQEYVVEAIKKRAEA